MIHINKTLVGVALASFLGFLVGSRCTRISPGEPPKPKVDTLVIRDTFTVTEPKYITRRVVDSVLVPVHDTTKIRDTLYAYLGREQVTWEDSLARIYASGIDPQVDSVIHFTQEMVITKEIPVIQVKKTRWGIGVQAGAGVGKDGLTPCVGVGVSYNILSW